MGTSYPSPKVNVVKSKKYKWAGHSAHMGWKINVCRVSV
jgi:hypothetical protein